MLTLTRHFVNRTQEFDRLKSALNSEGPEKDLMALVYGQPGIGKTQLLAKYLLFGRHTDIRTAYVDLQDRDYLGVISEIIEGLGKSGFDEMETTYDAIRDRSKVGVDRSTIENLQEKLQTNQSISSSEQTVGLSFMGNVTGRDQYFVNGPMTITEPKIENIFNINLNEPERVKELNQERITLAFQGCLSTIAREQPIVILLDHWGNANDPLRNWLNAHLLKWASQFILKKALVVLTRESLPDELVDQTGILPLAMPPFSREVALEFWKKNDLPVEDFDAVSEEIYSMPRILALEVGKQRLKRAKK
jgi:hypothetical protein